MTLGTLATTCGVVAHHRLTPAPFRLSCRVFTYSPREVRPANGRRSSRAGGRSAFREGPPLLTTPFVSARPRRVRNPLASDGMTLTRAEYDELDDDQTRKILAAEYRGA